MEKLISDKEILRKIEENLNTFLGFSDYEKEYWRTILIFCLIFERKEAYDDWSALVDEIAQRGDFALCSSIDKKLDSLAEYATLDLPPETKMYRARSANNKDTGLGNATSRLWDSFVASFSPELQENFFNCAPEEALTLFLLGSELAQEVLREGFLEAREEYEVFAGLSKEASDAPPREQALDGRVAKAGVPCLYASRDEETAIQEIRPHKGDYVSVAEIQTIRPLKLFNFAVDNLPAGEQETLGGLRLGQVSALFSRPCRKDPKEYLPTQYICSYLKAQGYDGVCFMSSLSSGLNYALFDTTSDDKGYRITRSTLHFINSLSISYSTVMPEGFLSEVATDV